MNGLDDIFALRQRCGPWFLNNNEVLNAKEAAVFLKAHVETVRRMARRGEIPAFKVGKDWRFLKKALWLWPNDGQPTTVPRVSSLSSRKSYYVNSVGSIGIPTEVRTKRR